MDKRLALPMIALCLLLTGCGGGEEAADLRRPYQEMTGCSMEAVVTCGQEDLVWEGTLRCSYVPGGESTVEVLAPETIAGVRAVLSDSDWYLEYGDMSLNAGALSREAVSPAACLPRLMDALRDGWLLEENRETWGETPCVRLAVDQTGGQGGKLVSTLWLREEDGLPLRGELAVDGEIILTAEFTSFSFCDTLN